MGVSDLAKHLIRDGFMTANDYKLIAHDYGGHGPTFAKVVVAMNLMDETALAQYIAVKSRTPFLGKPSLDISPEVLAAVDMDLVRELEVIPFELNGKTLKVGMADPLDRSIVEQLRFFTNFRIVPRVITLSCARASLSKALNGYKPPRTNLETLLLARSGATKVSGEAPQPIGKTKDAEKATSAMDTALADAGDDALIEGLDTPDLPANDASDAPSDEAVVDEGPDEIHSLDELAPTGDDELQVTSDSEVGDALSESGDFAIPDKTEMTGLDELNSELDALSTTSTPVSDEGAEDEGAEDESVEMEMDVEDDAASDDAVTSDDVVATDDAMEEPEPVMNVEDAGDMELPEALPEESPEMPMMDEAAEEVIADEPSMDKVSIDETRMDDPEFAVGPAIAQLNHAIATGNVLDGAELVQAMTDAFAKTGLKKGVLYQKAEDDITYLTQWNDVPGAEVSSDISDEMRSLITDCSPGDWVPVDDPPVELEGYATGRTQVLINKQTLVPDKEDVIAIGSWHHDAAKNRTLLGLTKSIVRKIAGQFVSS